MQEKRKTNKINVISQELSKNIKIIPAHKPQKTS